ncbi:MAG: barstar family protein [Flavobacteriales bacterium]
MEGINFLNNPVPYNSSDIFVVHISGINNKNELLKQLNNKLLFPDYFGFNWDSLLDVLCDFHWIKQREILIIHDDLPSLDKTNFKTYLEILFEAINTWKNWENGQIHYLEVVFPEQNKKLIQQLGHYI